MKVNQNGTLNFEKLCLLPVVEETVGYRMSQEPFFNWAKENADKLDEPLIKALASNLNPLNEDGDKFMKNLKEILKQKEVSDQLIELLSDSMLKPDNRPTSYDGLVKIGYSGEVPNGGFGSPAVSVLEDVKRTVFYNRGLSTDSKGNLILNANVFAYYVLRRMNLVQLENGQIYVYSRKGYYIELNDRILKTLCRSILHEAKPHIWCRKWETEYFEALKREIPYVDYMNSAKEYLNLTNGMLNLYTMEFVEHDPKYLSTVQVPIEYDETAACPQFRSFLEDVFEEDEERINLIQELLGYCFLPEIKIQKAFIFVGLGSNGKSVLSEVIRHLVGIENVSNVALNDLGGRFGMQNLPGKLVNISSENEFDKKFNTQNFKMITGGDAVNVEQKYKDSFNTVLFAKTIVLLNRMMDSDDLSNGYFRRLQIVPFNKIYKELRASQTPVDGVSYMDKTLTEKLLKELPGIFVFALEGLRRLVQNDFNLTESKVCEQALDEYRVKQNPVAEYIKECIYPEEKKLTLRSDLKVSFSKWAAENGFDNVKSMNTGKFLDTLRRVLIEDGIIFREPKQHGYYYFEGIGTYN